MLIAPDAEGALSGYIAELSEIKSSFKDKLFSLRDFSKYPAAIGLKERIASVEQGILKNLELLENSYNPILKSVETLKSLQESSQAESSLAWASVLTSFSANDMLPYFFQDWSEQTGSGEVRDLICGAIATHVNDYDSIAVLGAGACGLLYHVTGHFTEAYGLDLSLPTLLIAKRLIEGESLTLHVPAAGWQSVTLESPKPLNTQPRYVAASVTAMPFPAESQSVVMTQYLMDLVGNPAAIAQEIHRVLKAGGVWINFSNPFRLPEDPPILDCRRLEELPAFFEESGFSPLHLEKHRFKLLDLERLSSEVDKDDQIVHFFVVRKSEAPLGSRLALHRRNFFAAGSDVLKKVPYLVEGRQVSLSRKIGFSRDGLCEETEIGIDGERGGLVLPESLASLLDVLFRSIDGKQTLGALLVVMRSEGVNFKESDFLELIYILHVQHFLIELKDPDCEPLCPDDISHYGTTSQETAYK